MEGRSGAVVVLATGIDPSPLVLLRRATLPFSLARYCCASVLPRLLLPSSRARRLIPVPLRPPPLSSLSFSNALGDAHTDWRAAGYARTRYIRANADHSSRSSTRLLDSLTLLSSSLPLSSRFRGVFFLFLSLNIQIRRALAVHRPYLCALILIYAFFLYALPSRLPLVCVFFFALSLIVAGDDLFTGRVFSG